MAIIGIDLGTTNSLAVCYKNGKAEMIKNSLGSYITPSAVSIDDNGDLLIGEIAKERLISCPKCSVSEFKRCMGTDTKYELSGKKYSAEELSAMILKKIKIDAENYLGEPVNEAIISVPAYFDDNKRSSTKLAAKMAGLNVNRLINEPSAAALAYISKHDFTDGTFMVIDFGGGTLDISVVDTFDSVIEILAVAGDNMLGGKDFNEEIVSYFCNENSISYDSLTPDQKAILYKNAENCKITLSSSKIAIMIANIDNKQYSITLDNNKLISISENLFFKFSKLIKKALRDSRCSVSDIDEIILVGGSCKMPVVKAAVEQITGIKPVTDIDPDKAIAIGAGIFAGIKDRNKDLKDVILTDICPFSLGTAVLDHETKERVMSFIISRNTSLPASRIKTYYAAYDMQDKVTFEIYQGESMLPSKNIFLGEISFECMPTKIDEPISDVRFTYDLNGILIVDVITKDNRTLSKTIISKKSSLSDEEIQKCISGLNNLKISPSESEKNKLLLAKSEALFEELLPDEREILSVFILRFKHALQDENSREIRIAYEKLEELIEKWGEDM